jgi:hypothetical protein
MLDTAVRAGNRAKLELMGRIGPIRHRSERRHQERLLEHRPFLPDMPAGREQILEVVRSEGACVSSLDELALPGTVELRAGLGRLGAALSDRADVGADTLRPPLGDVLAEPAVWRWGLSDELLDVAECYLGVPARYYGADLRLERANARTVGVRQWHRDVEDHRMFKVLIWLNDVGVDGGPFEYISRKHTDRLTGDLGYVSGFVGDDDLARRVPREEWRQATGPAGTAVLSDTRALFHRAKPPTQHDRMSVTFTYTSRSPLTTLPAPRVPREERALAVNGLSSRQRACLPRAFVS